MGEHLVRNEGVASSNLVISTIFFLLLSSYSFAAETRNADLAGSWYPASKPQLEAQLIGYLNAAEIENVKGDVLAVIVPHAGYAYSGPVAAYSYKEIAGRGIRTVIILGFTHSKDFNGVAIYDRDSWKTPLGEIQVDEALASEIMEKDPRVSFSPEAFKDENSVEMQVPFIQIALKGAKIVPIAFGNQDYRDAQALALALTEVLRSRKDCVIVASTDMSHYYPYQKAVGVDRQTIGAIGKLKAKELFGEGKMGICELCGLMPVTTALLVAENLGYDRIKELKYANSGDITGDKSRVVGYLSAAIYKDEIVSSRSDGVRNDQTAMLNDAQRKRLLGIARESITGFLKDGKRKQFTEKDPVLNKPMGAFVTLHEAGELRGCIGNMVASGPLYQTVADMAIEAATGDPRFQKLSAKDVDRVKIEISALSPLKKVSGPDQINIPGDGVIVRSGFKSGVYLPQVATETGWSKEEFLTSLCAHKAGLPSDAWKDPATELYTFTAEVFGEGGEVNAK